MVTPMNVWEWLGTNSDPITSLIGITAILLAFFVAWKSPKWQYEAEYKISIIKDVFPELTSDIKNTIDLYHKFLEGKIERYGKFSNLFEIINTGEIRQINKIDKTLHNNLIKIKDEIYPLMDEMQQGRNDLMRVLKARWERHLNSLEYISFDIPRFVSNLWSDVSFNLWIENYDIFLSQSEVIFNIYRNEVEGIVPPTDEQILELRNIAEVEIARIKENVEPIEVKIKEIITDVVIDRLEKIIADPF